MGFDFIVIAPLLPSHSGFSFVFGCGVSFLVSYSVFLSMIVQQLVVILVFSQEGVRARPVTPPSWFLSTDPFPLLIRIPVIGFRAHPLWYNLTLFLNSLHLQRLYFHIRSHSQFLGKCDILRDTTCVSQSSPRETEPTGYIKRFIIRSWLTHLWRQSPQVCSPKA